jgi:hypothetical protein
MARPAPRLQGTEARRRLLHIVGRPSSKEFIRAPAGHRKSSPSECVGASIGFGVNLARVNASSNLALSQIR